MMGRSHVTLTALGWMTLGPIAARHAGHPMDVPTVLASTAAAAGASLWPDWDHPKATLATTLGPVSQAVANGINRIARGHRHGTHTLVFCAVAGGLAGVVGFLPDSVGPLPLPANWGGAVLLFFLAYTLMLCLGLAVVKRTALGDGIYLAQALAVTIASVLWVRGPWWWLPWAVGAGCLLHCIQDMLTAGGLPWFWRPFSRKGVRMPVCGETGGLREMTLSAAGLGALLWVTLATCTGHVWWSASWLQR
ncbi:hypothetical protein BIV57_02155 [Mangrovactinospora gilvigrisea]|uniref:Metal-dependent hydrolase n=1 Tax=Mangrovactinospora gilvigrisea TaxID=1428644 RepID=A0A1J7BKE1_9ACTN|nr:metal-dependent hydrolase [Mangrovactinospora gilvigrisea]OIV39155.1 hypothetical protein BIV57_02155 [Mangrovactinospora gilvigrisea]